MPETNPTPRPTPQMDVLEALLGVFTLEQLEFIAKRSAELLADTGFGKVTILFDDKRFNTLERTESFQAPRELKKPP